MVDKNEIAYAFPTDRNSPEYRGMTLRDYFAGQALAGMAARDSFDEGQATPLQRAKLAYIEADAMLVQRQKP